MEIEKPLTIEMLGRDHCHPPCQRMKSTLHICVSALQSFSLNALAVWSQTSAASGTRRFSQNQPHQEAQPKPTQTRPGKAGVPGNKILKAEWTRLIIALVSRQKKQIVFANHTIHYMSRFTRNENSHHLLTLMLFQTSLDLTFLFNTKYV